MSLAARVRILGIAGVITLIGNWIFTKGGTNPIQAIPGMITIIVIVVAGILLKQVVPIKLPALAYISLIGIIVSLPSVPFSTTLLAWTGKVQFLALCTPVLAYAGVSIGKDIGSFAKLGPKIIVIALLVFTGTYVGSALIAQLLLSIDRKSVV